MPTEEELAAAAAVEAENKEPEEIHEGFVSDEQHKERIGVQHKRFRDEERGRVKEKDRADAAEKELEDLKGTQAEVVVTPVPDKYSDNYDADMAERDAAITAKADKDAADATAVAKRKQQDEARQVEADSALNDRVVVFDKNLAGHGLKSDEVKAAAETVIGFGISNEFQDVLLEDPDGPLMVQYLAANPVEAETINGMSTLQRVNHLNTEVRPKALLLKPKTSEARDPRIVPSGGGAPETKQPWEKGAVYE